MATSIKLSEDLKNRVARVVKGTDQSAHAFMVEAIRHETERAEKRRQFVADAYTALAQLERDGKGYALSKITAHYHAKLQRKKSRKPILRSWQK